MKKRAFYSLALFYVLGCTMFGYATKEMEFPHEFPFSDNDFNINSNPTCNGAASLEFTYVGGNYGSWVYVVNKSPNRAISVTVRTRWVYQGDHREQTDVYSLAPGEKKYIGYTNWQTQVFTRDIVGCQLK